MSGNILLGAALARARKGALLLPLYCTEEHGLCQCLKGAACPSPGKHPLSLHGLDDATSDPETIEGWWGRWPQANIGERTDNVARIDVDLLDVAAKLAQDTALPLTTEVVRTPRGGLHIAAATPAPVQSRTLYLQDRRKLGELKAARAYVLVPPSVVGGRPYTRLSPDGIGPMQVDDPVAWLARLLPAFGFALASEQPDRRRDYEALGGVIYEGEGRHNALTSYAGRIWVDGMAPETLRDLLRVVNNRQCRPPLPDRELREIAEHFAARRQYIGHAGLEVVRSQDSAHSRAPEPLGEDYHFSPATTSAFVRRFISWRERANDAALEYAEAHAIGTLAALAGPRLRIPLRQKPRPVACNLLIALVGPSTIARKSDVQEHTHWQLQEVVPAHLIESPGSPEGFVQDLARHQAGGAVLLLDELAWWFNALKRKSHMSDLKGYVMRAHDGSPVSRRNRAKKQRDIEGGYQLAEDADIASEPCLTVLGTSTPERLAQVSTREDIDDGWWPRWAIVWPQTRPPMRPMGPPDEKIGQLRARVTSQLRQLHTRLGEGVQAVLTDEAWKVANCVLAGLEQRALDEPEHSAFLSRMEVRVLKVAALLALADDAQGGGNVIVNDSHVQQADRLCDRWLGDALRFAETVGLNEFEYALNRAWRALLRFKGHRAPRRDIARVAHVPARVMDEIERTLQDRGLIQVTEVTTSGRSQKLWIGEVSHVT